MLALISMALASYSPAGFECSQSVYADNGRFTMAPKDLCRHRIRREDIRGVIGHSSSSSSSASQSADGKANRLCQIRMELSSVGRE
jgi:hypothetical protein